MADNIAITAGSGTNVAADDIGSVFYQRVKISQGADGAASDVSSANPLPVSILSNISLSANVFNAGGSLSAFQGGNWLVSVATLPVMANVVNSTIAVTQSGTWDEVGINDSGNSITVDGGVSVAGGSLSSWAAGGSLSAFQGGAWSVANNGGSISSYAVGGSISAFNVGGSLSAFQGGAWTVQPGNTPNTTAWLVTMATLPVVGTFDVAGQATVTALQGDAGSSPWRVTMATLPVIANVVNSTLAVTQSGTWDEVGINDSGNSITVDGNLGNAGGSVSAFNAGGSLSVFQGTPFWQVTMATMPIVGDFSLSGDVGVAGGSLSNWNAGGSLSAFQGGTWTVQPGNTPNTTAWLVTMATLSAYQGNAPWLVTMATLPVIGDFALSGAVDQGDAGSSAWLVTMATLPVMSRAVGGSISSYVFGGSLSAFNAGGSLSAFQGGTWNVGVIGGSISAYGRGQYLPSLISLTSQDFYNTKLDRFGNLMVNTNVPLPESARFNRFYTQASMASISAAPGAGKRLVVRELDFSGNATLSFKIIEDQGGTPATVWGPHYFLPYAGVSKTQTYIPLTANKSLGVDIQPTGLDATVDLRVETENV